MDEIVSQNAADNLFKLFVLTTALILFWILESAWRNDKRWLIPIFIFPPSLFLFVVNYWQETRGKCFFAALLFIMMLLVSGVAEHELFSQLMNTLKVVAFWPYYVGTYLAVKVP